MRKEAGETATASASAAAGVVTGSGSRAIRSGAVPQAGAQKAPMRVSSSW